MFGFMGNCLTWAKGKKETRKVVTLLAVGLDNAGKTTTVHGVKGDPNDDVAPTIGFSSVDLSSGKYDIKIYDLGGGARIRDIWQNYMAESHAVIFVIDSSDVERMEECRMTFEKVVSDSRIRGKPVLILANKQDKPDALDENDLCDHLNLEEVVNRNECLSRVEHCSALSNTGKRRRKRKLDRGIKTGFAWLLDVIGRDYNVLQDRITKDVKEQQGREEEERKQRIERVRKRREERERQENGETQENQSQPDHNRLSEDTDPPKNEEESISTPNRPQENGKDTGLGMELLDDDEEVEEEHAVVHETVNGNGMILTSAMPGTVVTASTSFTEQNQPQEIESELCDNHKWTTESVRDQNSEEPGSRSLSKASLREIVQDTPSPRTPQRTPLPKEQAPTPWSVTSVIDEELGNDSENTTLTEDSIQKKTKKKRKRKKRKVNKIDPLQAEEGDENLTQPRPLPGRLTPIKTASSSRNMQEAFGTLPT